MDWREVVHGAHPRQAPATERFTPGDDVRVWFKIVEQGKERLGQFEGVVIRLRGAGPSRTMTVRRMTHGVGVERVFPMDAPIIERVEVLRHGKAKRSRLYFLRRVVRSWRLETEAGLEDVPPGAAHDSAAPAAGSNRTAGAGGAEPSGGGLPPTESASRSEQLAS